MTTWRRSLYKLLTRKEFEDKLKFIIDFYKDDFNAGQLVMQLKVMSTNIPTVSTPHNLGSVLQVPETVMLECAN